MWFETTRDINKACKDVSVKFSKKYITSNILPIENAPYPTANRDTEHTNPPPTPPPPLRVSVN